MRDLLVILILTTFFFGCQKDEDPTTWKNQIPIIESVTANPDTILVNGETTLNCIATDPDGDSLTIEWKAKAGLFPIINTGKSVKWKAPDSVGIYPITAFVTDGKDTESDTVYVTVVKTPQPILKTPSDNAVDVSIPATLEWEAINGVIGYNLQVSTDSLFSTLIFNQGELVDNSQQIEGLNYLTKYYWRVRATNSYGTSNWSTVWNFTTTGTAPAVPTLSTPANNATGQAVNPTLTWNTSSGASSYTLQVSTNSNFTSYVYNQSGLTNTSQQLSGLNHLTQYYWRVNATNSYGTSNFSSVWNFTTTGTAPAVPTLSTPANNATGQPINPTLTWNKSGGATSYTLQVSTNSNFTSFVYNQSGLTNTSQQLSGLNHLTQYYWRVNATNSYGTSNWSTIWKYTTTGTAPAVPTLSTPANNATGQPINPTLTWNTSNGATSYTLQVSTNSNFTSFVYNQSGLTNTSQQLSGLNHLTQYYWRVNATNSYGTSNWSTIWKYTTTGTAPAVPTLSTPANNATGQPINPTLTWNTSNGATSYTLQVSTNSNFTSYVYNQSGLTNTSQQLSGLSYLTQYYWRVSATNSYGTSNFSSVWNLTTTGTAPAVPTLSTPANNATGQPINPTLTWNTSSGATSYTLQVSTNSNFTSYVYNQSGLTNTSQQLSGLSYLTQYYWRVSATNSYGTSNWSSVWNFTTTGTAPAVPTLSTPTNNATGQAINPTLTWNTSSGATSYTLQVSTNSNFTSYVYNQSELTNTSQQLSGLSYLTQYYWRVSATNSYGTSNFSSVWNFATTGTAPAVPTLSTPANNATGQPINPTLTWNTSSGATNYTLQVSTNSNFTSYVYNQSGLTNTNQQISGLSYLTQYYWRVNSTNSYGTSNWSSVWNFTTTGTAPAVPTLITPANNATGQAVNPTLTWNTSNGATSYTLQVSTNSNFTSFVYNQSGLTNSSQQLSGLSHLTQYYWRVNAINSYGTSNYSSVWNFTTLNQAGGQPCPGIPTVTYAGKTYNTVLIGSQCWLKENLDVGTMIQGNQTQTNNSVIEKYCYNNDVNNCNIYGGLYQWNESMQYTTTAGTKGVCPPGWYIPTNAEFETLRSAVGNNGNALKAVGQGNGSGAGTNTSGFSALLAGCRNNIGAFDYLGDFAYFWSSTEVDVSEAYYLGMHSSHSNIFFNFIYKYWGGFSVRCLQD